MNYIHRTIEKVLRRAAGEFPAVVVTGPRQSGKTTVLRQLFGEGSRYISLEPPDVREAVAADPRGFLAAYTPPVILDEVQYGAGLLPYIKERIDSERGRTGQYLLTGSQNLLMGERVTESLAGRAAILKLLPLTWREERGAPEAALPWEGARGGRHRETREMWEGFLRGGYPELAASPRRDIRLWHSSYVQTYLERDIRSLRQIGDLTTFQSFLRALAARSAQLLNLAEMARDLGVALNTVKSWLSLLEATYQVIVLRPWFANIGKRLVKSPKVYFTDTGTLCYLTGLRDWEHAAAGPMAGAIFETAVIAEVFKTLLHRSIDPQIYFWRTSTGSEVDLIIENAGQLTPIEIKLSATPTPRMASGICSFRDDIGASATPGFLIHSGEHRSPLAPGVTAIPFSDLC